MWRMLNLLKMCKKQKLVNHHAQVSRQMNKGGMRILIKKILNLTRIQSLKMNKWSCSCKTTPFNMMLAQLKVQI